MTDGPSNSSGSPAKNGPQVVRILSRYCLHAVHVLAIVVFACDRSMRLPTISTLLSSCLSNVPFPPSPCEVNECREVNNLKKNWKMSAAGSGMSEVKTIREAVADRGVVGALIDKPRVLFTNIRYLRYQPFQSARVSALYTSVFDRLAHNYQPVGVLVS